MKFSTRRGVNVAVVPLSDDALGIMPDDFDGELAERGYTRVGEISKKTNNFGHVVEVYAPVIRYE